MASSEILSAYQSPAKKQRCEGAPQPESPLEETEDPRSKIEFYTYNEDVEDDSDGMHEITQEELDEYLRQIDESDGFNVMHFPRSFACGQICPILNMERDGQDLKSHSQLALQQYNEQKKTNLEFVKVVKANWEGVAGINYYITFDVKDPDAVDGRTMEFQASVWDGISETTIDFCRPKPNRVISDIVDAVIVRGPDSLAYPNQIGGKDLLGLEARLTVSLVSQDVSLVSQDETKVVRVRDLGTRKSESSRDDSICSLQKY